MVRAAAPHNINRTAAAEYHYYIHNPQILFGANNNLCRSIISLRPSSEASQINNRNIIHLTAIWLNARCYCCRSWLIR